MSLCLLQTAQAGLGQQSPSSIQLVALPRGGQGQGGSSGALAAPASPIQLHGWASSSPLGAPNAGLPLQGTHAGAPGLGAVLRAPLIPAGISGHPTKGGAIAPFCASANFCMAGSHGQRIPPDFPFLHISTVHYFPSSMR